MKHDPRTLRIARAAGISLAGLLVGLGGCRVSGDFRAAALPDPVPRDPRTGAAHFFVEIHSLAKRAVHVGRPDGPLLRPGSKLRIPADLEPNEHELRIGIFDADGLHIANARAEVATYVPDPADETVVPIPRLGGYEVRVTSGFHAPNHREPGRRQSLDVVPVIPDGGSAFGVEVRSPFAGRVIGMTRNQPDVPGARPNELLLEDTHGNLWRLAHFQQGSIPLVPEQEFAEGQLLGRIGLSGQTTGPHLHIERVLRASQLKKR